MAKPGVGPSSGPADRLSPTIGGFKRPTPTPIPRAAPVCTVIPPERPPKATGRSPTLTTLRCYPMNPSRRMLRVVLPALLLCVAVAATVGRAADVSPRGLKSAARAAPPKRGDWPCWGGSPDRNMVSDEKGIPYQWDVKTGRNIKWSAPLGSQTYGNPVIVDGKLFIGTNNNGNRRPGIEGDKGVILCLDEKTGRLLWQATHDKLPTGRVNDWPEQGICSSPAVEGNRLYYVSNRCELVCADVEGFLDGENDGPFTDEKYKEKLDGDFVWVLDMIEELGSFPHNLATSSPVIGGGLVFVLTSNGVDEGHLNLPVADAPSFLAVDTKTGKIVWESDLPGDKVLHGQWSSPAYGMIGGVEQVIMPGGDGVCYSFEPKTGKLLWRFDLNPKDSKWELGGRGTRNNIIATPVIHDDKVYLCVGQDPEHGEGVGHLYAIDGTQRGDITKTGRVWHVGGDDFHRSMSSCAIADGLLYAADLSGFVYCLDAKTGRRHWRFDTFAAIWGSPFVVDGKVLIGDEDGELVILAQGSELKELATHDMRNSIYTTPVVANGVLYITNRNTLFAIQEAGSP
ncbi:MAG: PQQ-binding-like beta-propeller repeat protein [Planctomycetes bacterium]|nr:PQQ-binding-like beta-propeller repeat protein [Planctomycetota bacterium]